MGGVMQWRSGSTGGPVLARAALIAIAGVAVAFLLICLRAFSRELQRGRHK